VSGERADDNADNDDDAEFDDGDMPDDSFPISHEVILKDHEKVVSAFAIDSAGARVATASHDYDVKLWDFGGMDHRMKPFKTFEPSGNYQVRTTSLLRTGVSETHGSTCRRKLQPPDS
jgi:WD40 repeat protein